MHGLIFVTWEKYLADRYGFALLDTYRRTIGETPASAPLAHRVYSDELLLAGVKAAVGLTHVPSETLLREYGRYFILNGLTSKLCGYLLNQVHSGRDLLITMRAAHDQMSRTAEAIVPPIFEFEAIRDDPGGLILDYQSQRKLCMLLEGTIQGAAERYGERASVRQLTCMLHGAPSCRLAIHFARASAVLPAPGATPEQQERWKSQRDLADMVYAVLPDAERAGITLTEIAARLRSRHVGPHFLRPSVLLDAVYHLQHAGLAAVPVDQQGDDLMRRRYWRVPRI